MISADAIAARIRALPEAPGYADFRSASLGFHGTAEPIAGALRPGGYDAVLWLAETPAVAQAYIPLAGATVLLSAPLDYRLQERIRPNRHDVWADVMHQMGHWPREVEYDHSGQAQSWTVDPGHPTYAEALRFVTALGYELSAGPAWVATTMAGGRDVLRPADYRTPGMVQVTLLDGLDIVDMREALGSDLSDPGHRQLDLFRQLEEAGHDGVMIDDFAQCGRDHVNIGHPSIGLFAGTLGRMSFLSFPATHCDLQAFRDAATDDFRAFRRSL